MVDDKAVEKMKHDISRKNNLHLVVKMAVQESEMLALSKVTEKYKRNKYHEVNYCYGEGESL